MSGIPLRAVGALFERSTRGNIPGGGTHIARRVPEDEAREAVIAAARAYREAAPGDDRDARDRAYLRLGAALDHLDALAPS